ncbi:MAG: riboflavin synthase [Deltaproteobacteria bacterium]|jgi:riboflavin synthase|nr:riboflavin synthase [Deltaproteobacteria bacterium]
MFTGLVEGTGTLKTVEPRGKDMRLSIEASFELEGFQLGESVSVDGVCLTVVSWEARTFTVDVSQETLNRSTLGQRHRGDEVNLERALRLGDRLGGHLVNGHVDGKAGVIGRKRRGDSWVFQFKVAVELGRYIIEKGSVAVNGVSLTVNGCDENSFEVNIVPHTFEVTTLEGLQVGDEVNIEVDIIGKYVEKFVRNTQESDTSSTSKVDKGFLAKHGFL